VNSNRLLGSALIDDTALSPRSCPHAWGGLELQPAALGDGFDGVWHPCRVEEDLTGVQFGWIPVDGSAQVAVEQVDEAVVSVLVLW
jgi:hypothetical protein